MNFELYGVGGNGCGDRAEHRSGSTGSDHPLGSISPRLHRLGCHTQSQVQPSCVVLCLCRLHDVVSRPSPSPLKGGSLCGYFQYFLFHPNLVPGSTPHVLFSAHVKNKAVDWYHTRSNNLLISASRGVKFIYTQLVWLVESKVCDSCLEVRV